MKLASHNWMRPEPLETTLVRLERCGYDAIEISGEPERYKVEEVKSLLERYHISCWGAVSIMLPGRDLVSEVEETRRTTVQYLEATADLIAGLGGKIFCIVPSTVGKTASVAEPEDEWKWAIEGLREVNAYCRERDIAVAIEPINRFETNFIYNQKQALRLAQEVGDDVGVCLDAFHINIEESDPIAAIRAVGDRLFDFHVADTNRRSPGEGHHNWDAIIDAVRSTGYDGCLTNEVVIPFDRTPVSRTELDRDVASGASAEDMKFVIDHGSNALTEEEYEKSIQATADYLGRYLR